MKKISAENRSGLSARVQESTAAPHDLADKGFRLRKLALAVALALPGAAYANSTGSEANIPEFDLAFIQGGGEQLDLAEFLRQDNVAPGTYRVDIYVNRALTGRRDIRFDIIDKSGRTKPCLTLEVLEKLGVDVEKLKRNGVIDTGLPDRCYDASELIDKASVEYDAARLQLHIGIPQAAMLRSARGYVDPALWDYGVNAGFVNYQFSGRRSENSGSTSDYYSLGLRNGLNIGQWRLRNESSLSDGSGNKRRFTSNRIFAERDITSLKSQLTLGETYTSSQTFDSVRFLGIQLSSDEAMLPDSQRGYAPVIHGTAQTNATVEVSQNGYLLYSTTVSPGPFEISDIYPSGSNGDLEITVIEADGSRSSFTQVYASLPQMVRRGMLRYNAAAGEYASNNPDDAAPSLATLGFAYGLTNATTLVGGVQWAEDYRATNVGVTQNTPLGAFAIDVTQSNSETRQQRNRGQSLRLNYAKTLAATNTTFTLATYRYSTEDYRTLGDHVTDLRFMDGNHRGRAKNRFDITINQSLGSRGGSFYLNGTEQRYWNLPGSSQQLRVGYSNNWGSINYNIDTSFSRNDASNYKNDKKQVALSISMPLGSSQRSSRVSSNLNYDNQGRHSTQMGLNGNLPGQDDAYYNLQAGHDSSGGGSGSASLSAVTSVARVNAGYSQGRDYQTFSAGASGSVVAHAGGINLGQPVGDTFTLAEVSGVSNAKFSSHAGVITGRNGYAVVPSAQIYRTNWLTLDARDLGADTELLTTAQQLVPRRGSITLASFAAESGRRVQFEFRSVDGSPIPFGASVQDENGKVLGVLDPKGMALALVDQEESTLIVKWKSDSCQAHYILAPRKLDTRFDKVQLACK
ncbi:MULTISPECIES: fimbria/pilus outer membrane usher protein [unclassified Pseudomonas]|uniref:fimbria/pilus outer membrane usher protein n=1 Tax=unclassified Pseudomonas TaxID=196821 RepID=UPI000F565EE5|nr:MULTISPECIES: fimbria/pilus outer membrane usher protein [unclassified Pseudomonas]AZF26262.1 Outer membrane usher protein fimD precursor [Pseudomonas sp. R2-60-08W]AZF31627.1 Outer membrane usher protein fimD precursor [Pseudomonas sp. R4-35-07]